MAIQDQMEEERDIYERHRKELKLKNNDLVRNFRNENS
jgi:hypothetical protein